MAWQRHVAVTQSALHPRDRAQQLRPHAVDEWLGAAGVCRILRQRVLHEVLTLAYSLESNLVSFCSPLTHLLCFDVRVLL